MKKAIRDNYRVEVAIDSSNWEYIYRSRPEKLHLQRVAIAKEVQQQINRHVDDVASTYVLWDTEYICSHCGYKWEVCQPEQADEDWEVGIPLCCEKAQEEWLAEQKEKEDGKETNPHDR